MYIVNVYIDLNKIRNDYVHINLKQIEFYKVTSYPCIAESVKCKQKNCFFLSFLYFSPSLFFFSLVFMLDKVVSTIEKETYFRYSKWTAHGRSNKIFFFISISRQTTIGEMSLWANSMLVHLDVNSNY